MKKVKLLAMYLPQYHEIPENSEFWGKGFTDWVSVKKAKSLYDGHEQPVAPYNDYYYDLSKKESIAWQIDQAKKYGVYGFGIYHYWFSEDKVLLTKPAEIILENKDLDIPFFFGWDNANWRRSWSRFRGNAWAPIEDNNQQKNSTAQGSVLIEYKLGEKPQWKKHFDYLLPYFKDERYIKVDNKPLFEIINYSSKIGEMVQYWNELAIENGFAGMTIIYKKSFLNKLAPSDNNFCYEPVYSGWGGAFQQYVFKALTILKMANWGPYKYSYDKVWNAILKNAKNRTKKNEWQGAFVSYDDTPRRGKQGRIVVGSTPDKFKKYLKKLMDITEQQGKEYILLTAWNEWGEGAMLEPTKKEGFAYLEAIKDIYEERDNAKHTS